MVRSDRTRAEAKQVPARRAASLLVRLVIAVGVVVAGLALAPASANAASAASLHFVWSSSSPSLGELVVTTANPDLVADVALTGGVFASSGSAVASSVRGGDRLAVVADTPVGGAVSMNVEASAEFVSAVDGSTASAWTASIVTRQPAFTPVVSAVLPAPLAAGEQPGGTITIGTSGSTWPTRVDGSATRIRASGTLYGPLADGITLAAAAGSPVAATASVLIVNGAADYPFVASATVSTPGRYAWVWTISRADQTGGACGCVLPSGYRAPTAPVELTLASTSTSTPPAPISVDVGGTDTATVASVVSATEPMLAETGVSPSQLPAAALLLLAGTALLVVPRLRRARRVAEDSPAVGRTIAE